MAIKFKIKKGDNVIVIAGRDKGRTGAVLRVLRTRNRVLVQGVNMMKRHTKQSAATAGGVVEKEAAIHISNFAHIDPKTSRPTRVGFKILEGGRKVRIARRSGESIDL